MTAVRGTPTKTGGQSLQDVADTFGLTRERIRQVEAVAIKKLAKSRLLRELAPGPERYRKRIEPGDLQFRFGDFDELRALLDEKFPFVASRPWESFAWPKLHLPTRVYALVRREMRATRETLESELGEAKGEEQIEAEAYVRWM